MWFFGLTYTFIWTACIVAIGCVIALLMDLLPYNRLKYKFLFYSASDFLSRLTYK